MIEESPSTQIAWRLNPQISYSDWILEVTRLPNDGLFPSHQHDMTKKKDIYHVHKTHLSCGPRKSSYFVGLFHSNKQDITSSTTRMECKDSVADAMPMFLDYLYGADMDIDSPDVAVALHYLSDYFGVEPLKQEVFEYVRKNMMNTKNFQRARSMLLQDQPNATTTNDDAMLDHDDKENQDLQDSDSVILESCLKSATRWNLVRDRLLSCQNQGLVELVTQMLTLEQKNLLYFYALREQSNGRHRRRPLGESNGMLQQIQSQDQLVMEAQLTRVQQEMIALKERLETLQNQNEAYSHAFGSLKQDKEQLEAKNQWLQERTKEMDHLHDQVTSLKQTNQEQQQAQSHLQQQVQDLQQQNAKLQHERNTQDSKLSVLYNSAERLERKLTKAKAKNQTNLVATKEQLDCLQKNQLQEISRIKGEASKQLFQLQSQTSRWREENTKLKRQCELLEELYWTGGR